jgi:hypothetical protein
MASDYKSLINDIFNINFNSLFGQYFSITFGSFFSTVFEHRFWHIFLIIRDPIYQSKINFMTVTFRVPCVGFDMRKTKQFFCDFVFLFLFGF